MLETPPQTGGTGVSAEAQPARAMEKAEIPISSDLHLADRLILFVWIDEINPHVLVQ